MLKKALKPWVRIKLLRIYQTRLETDNLCHGKVPSLLRDVRLRGGLKVRCCSALSYFYKLIILDQNSINSIKAIKINLIWTILESIWTILSLYLFCKINPLYFQFFSASSLVRFRETGAFSCYRNPV